MAGQDVPAGFGNYFSSAFICLALVLSCPVTATETPMVPDFSGQWGRDWAFLEQPASGPGPIVSALKNADGTFNTQALVGDYNNPMLKPEAVQQLKRRGQTSLRGALNPDPVNQCWPEPVPFALGVEFGMQILQYKDEVTLLYIGDHKVRHIRMNASHPSSVTPTWQGDSVGHYEGNTRVIDTVGQKVGTLSVLDLYGTPFSSDLHVIERYRLIDGETARAAVQKRESAYLPPGKPSPIRNTYGRGPIDPDTATKGLQVEITVEDRGVFTAPWSALVTYQHITGRWPEMVCAEAGFVGNLKVEMPRAASADF